MREILFRGKRADNGEWVYGSLISTGEYCCILQSEENVHPMDYPYLCPDLGTIDGQATPVIPETVGQYTGLKDKDGRKIFEGDVVHYELAHMSESGYPYKDAKYNHPKVGPVVFTDQCFLPLAYCVEDRILISGNIHDNPELLEVE